MIPWDIENFMYLVKEAAAAKYFFFYTKQPLVILKRKAPNLQPAHQMGAEAGARSLRFSWPELSEQEESYSTC